MANFAGSGPENKGPSTAELQRMIKGRCRLEFMLVNGKNITGVLKWCDEQAFCVIQEDQSTLTLFRSGIIGYKVANETTSAKGTSDQRDQRDSGSQKPSGSKKHGR